LCSACAHVLGQGFVCVATNRICLPHNKRCLHCCFVCAKNPLETRILMTAAHLHVGLAYALCLTVP
jgi:hypothetical protein